MSNKVCAVWVLMFLLIPVFLCAQQVQYATYGRNPFNFHFEVIGKVGNFYWVQKTKKSDNVNKAKEKKMRNKDFTYEVYDNRMNWFKTIPYTLTDSVCKEYLVAGDNYFDQLFLLNDGDQIRLILKRYTPEGDILTSKDTIASFPGNLKAVDFLLIRSQDRSKILLLAFEPSDEPSALLHAILCNSDWNILSRKVYKGSNLSQPFLQYDFTNCPLEDFGNSPVKLTNSGEWLMLAPSRRNVHYSLFYFHPLDSGFLYKDIQLTKPRGVQELSLSVDNEKKEALAGILFNSTYPSVKRVHIVRYSFAQQRFAFDTTYQFSTLTASKKEENLFNEYFLQVPGKGFLLLKEHGRPFLYTNRNEEIQKINEGEDTVFTASSLPVYYNKHDYTRYQQLSVRKETYERGDLNLYYFPAYKEDSCWSGLLNQEQTGDLNSADLSYAFVPKEGRLIFLYNSLQRGTHTIGSMTILDKGGHNLNEGMVFWKGGNILNFQRGRQISTRELAVPYERNGEQGFAVIRM